jgi:hypothetical protein
VRDLIVNLKEQPSEIAVLTRIGYTAHQVYALLKQMGLPCELLDEQVAADTSDEGDARARSPKVAVGTIHQAKAMEWLHVYVLTLEDGFFPNALDTDDAMSDRRVLFVAITRAKRYLTVWNIHPRTSRFIRELHNQGTLFKLMRCSTRDIPPEACDEDDASSNDSDDEPLTVACSQDIPCVPGKVMMVPVVDASSLSSEDLSDTDAVVVDPYGQIDMWLKNLNGLRFRQLRETFIKPYMKVNIAPIPIDLAEDTNNTAVLPDNSDIVQLLPWKHPHFFHDQGLREACKNFISAFIMRQLQALKFTAVEAPSRQQFKYGPADGNKYYGQMRARGMDIPRQCTNRIAAAYRKYQDSTCTSMNCLPDIFWTATAELVRAGKTAVMSVTIPQKQIDMYRPMLAEIDRVIVYLLTARSVFGTSVTTNHNDWQLFTSFHRPARESKDCSHVVVGERLIYWDNGGKDAAAGSIVKGLCLAILYNLARSNTRVNVVHVYDTIQRRICTMDVSAMALDQQQAFIEYLDASKRVHIK